jgi:D-inositol-3-phosphate glycosyltransferase
MVGFTGNGYVIPHGVDLRNFKPVSRDAARKSIFKEILPDNAFLFGCVNRNQGRKRQDLILYCFKKFLEETGAKDAYLYLHCAPDDMGYDLDQLTTYFGLDKKKVLMPMDNFTVWNQVKESSMHLIYNSMDVHLSTTQGEGWGLCNLESMTCGIPNILPDYAALGEWAKDAAYMVPVSSFMVNTGGLNTVGGVVDTDLFVEAMIEMYHNSSLRDHYSAKSLELAQNENFNWRNISGKFHSAMVETYNRWLEARQQT